MNNFGQLLFGLLVGAVIGDQIVSYKNKTYVIFEAGNDLSKYSLMKAWKNNKNIDFDFHDAHDLNTITNLSSEGNTKRKLRERFRSAKQVVVLVGEKTKTHYKFVRWEIEVALELGLPIVAAYINGSRKMDASVCPAILRECDAIHVSFQPKIIKYALDNFPSYDTKSKASNWHYKASVYKDLGL